MLACLHWLRIHFKVAVLTYRAVHLRICRPTSPASLTYHLDRGVRTADADIRGPGSADFLADADGPRIRQTNRFADADHPLI